jgi:NAD(P)H-hydrate epimerase
MREPLWLSRTEVREIDRRAADEYGMPGVVLMENAGRGVAELLLRLNHKEQPIHILCGPGNNGGDGFVLARHLHNAGTDVRVWLFAAATPTGPKLAADAAMNYGVWTKAMGNCTLFDTTTPTCLDQTHRQLLMNERGWLVDALFGTGLTRPLAEPYATLVAWLNASGRPLLALDIPSGMDADTGQPHGPTIRAKHTATFVAIKQGFRHAEAWPWIGKCHVIDIGVPRRLLDDYRQRATDATV